MARKRTEDRRAARAARALVRDREKLAALSSGGAAERPITVTSSAVIEVRAGALPCVQCEGEYRVVAHDNAGAGLRKVSVACRLCGTPRILWFRIVSDDPN
ncbi:MAG: hypothetical protein NT062_00050 [Proteobacteria bacterium]|nr:hypothetical protein [Pseudomonadota bacterium]